MAFLHGFHGELTRRCPNLFHAETWRQEPCAFRAVFSVKRGIMTMLETLQSLSLLTIAEIVGPILLAAGLIYGIYHSRRRRAQQPKRSGTVYAQDE
jgi:hypothetical protein